MFNSRLLVAGLATVAAASFALADFDGPAPLSWRWIQPTNAVVKGSPLIDGNTVYVAVGQRAFGLDKSSGNQKWRFPQVDPIDGNFLGAPVLINGTLIVSADNHKVYGLDPATGQEKWSYIAQQPLVGSAVKAGKYAVVAESDQSLMAIDPDTGTAAWVDDQTKQERPVKMLFGITGTLVGNGDDVLVTDNNDELVSVNTITKKASWTAKFTTLDSSSQPTVVGDLVVVNSGQYLTAVRGSNGHKAWQFPIGASVRVGPAVSGDGIFIVNEDGQGLYYDMTGRRVTKTPIELGSFPIARPAVCGRMFVVPTTNGALNLVDPITGKVSWSYLIRPIGVQYNQAAKNNQSGSNPGNPGIGTGRNQGSNTGSAQNTTPDRIWTIQAAGTPIVSGDTLLVLARDGSLLAFDKSTGVDLTPPSVNMSWPRAGDQVNGESLEVLFKIEDEASGINDSSLKITVDGAPVEVTFGRDGVASMRFSMASKNRPLQNGRRIFTVTVTDWMGNTAKQDFVLNIDNHLPRSVRPASGPNPNGPGKPGGPGSGGPGGIG
jgi:outer membrane protein assembly factor BamB